jgi:hypothetical protein
MSEGKPILFSAPMIRALLDGRKTQTRRVLTPQPDDLYEGQIPRQLHIAIGDRLWVREAWRAPVMHDHIKPSDLALGMSRSYEADDEQLSGFGNDAVPFPIGIAGKLRPGMFMMRWASRLTLIVTDVRVQRLREISEEDALAEGIQSRVWKSARFEPQTCFGIGDVEYHAPTASAAFADLWNSINGPDAWDANPWVAAYSFSVHRCNIDALELANAEAP